MKLFMDAAGWVGAVFVIAAYGLLSTKRWDGNSLRYQGFNAAGSLLLILNTLYYHAYPSTFVNVVWFGIAAVAVAAILRAAEPRLPK